MHESDICEGLKLTRCNSFLEVGSFVSERLLMTLEGLGAVRSRTGQVQLGVVDGFRRKEAWEYNSTAPSTADAQTLFCQHWLVAVCREDGKSE